MADDPRKTDHETRVKALNEANAVSAKTHLLPPTPTQEENDLMALGLMHPDEKDAGIPKGAAARTPAAHADPEHHRATTTTEHRRG